MGSESSQKFIARNRAPRVQIEYDVEIYGSEKKVQLPFVMGVLADLYGKPAGAAAAGGRPQVPRHRRRQFRRPAQGDEAARGRFGCRTRSTGEGELPVDITFESMDDFLPDAIARKVEPLRKLLEARNQLANLLTYMDGKAKAEELVAGLLQDPALMQALAAQPKAADGRGRRQERRLRPTGEQTMADDRDRRGTGACRGPDCDRRAERVPLGAAQGVAAQGSGGRGADPGRGRHAGAAGAAVGEPGLERRRQDDPGDHRPARPEADRAGQPDPAPRRTSSSWRAAGAGCTIWSTTPKPTRCSRSRS